MPLSTSSSTGSLEQLKHRLVKTLLEKKALHKYRLFGRHFVVAIDATGTMSFAERHCEHCLHQTSKLRQFISVGMLLRLQFGYWETAQTSDFLVSIRPSILCVYLMDESERTRPMSPETIGKSYTLLTLKEVAANLKISLRTVQRLVESDKLPSVYIRGARRVREVDLSTYIERCFEIPYNDNRV